MTKIQKFFKWLLPGRLFNAARLESQEWRMRCSCGYEITVWDAGGIRYKAAGNKKTFGRCPSCRKKQWFSCYRNPPSIES